MGTGEVSTGVLRSAGFSFAAAVAYLLVGLPGVPPTMTGLEPAPDSLSPPTEYRVSGTVTDDAGSPVVNAEVVADYVGVDPSSRWTGTHTGPAGTYGLVFSTARREFRGHAGAVGAVYGYAPSHWPSVQLLYAQEPHITRDLRLRPIRTITAGASITLSLEQDSSLASDLKESWNLSAVWERFRLYAGEAGILTVEAAGDTGAPVPVLEGLCAARSACGTFPLRPPRAPGHLSMPVHPGATYEIRVQVPYERAPQRYVLSTRVAHHAGGR